MCYYHRTIRAEKFKVTETQIIWTPGNKAFLWRSQFRALSFFPIVLNSFSENQLYPSIDCWECHLLFNAGLHITFSRILIYKIVSLNNKWQTFAQKNPNLWKTRTCLTKKTYIYKVGQWPTLEQFEQNVLWDYNPEYKISVSSYWWLNK